MVACFPCATTDVDSRQVGDFGTIDERSGGFKTAGNIFSDPRLQGLVSGRTPVQLSNPVDFVFFTSVGTEHIVEPVSAKSQPESGEMYKVMLGP